MAIPVMTSEPQLALAAIAAAATAFTKVINTGILGAQNADVARAFTAYRTGERASFDQLCLDLREAADGSLLIIPRHRWASWSATLKSCSLLVARSRM